MLTKISLEKFKSVACRTELALAPLTLFAGANSSGKSTVIQSILITAQTLRSTVSAKPVVLNGPIVRLGGYSDIAHKQLGDPGASLEKVTIGFDLDLGFIESDPTLHLRHYFYFRGQKSRLLRALSCDYSFSAQGIDDEREALELQPRLEECSFKLVLSEEIAERPLQLRLRRTETEIIDKLTASSVPIELVDPGAVAALSFEVESSARSPIELSLYESFSRRGIQSKFFNRIIGATFNHFLPSRFCVAYNEPEEYMETVLASLLSPLENRPLRFSRPPNTFEENSLKRTFTNILRDAYSEPTTRKTKRLNQFFEAVALWPGFSQVLSDWDQLPASIKQRLSPFFKKHTQELRKALKPSDSYNTLRLLPFPELVELGVDLTIGFFSGFVKYLGPLRDEPKPLYPLAGAVDPQDVGYKGEYTAAVLNMNGGSMVSYLPSHAFSKIASGVVRKIPAKRVQLIDAVRDWLEYLGVASEVKTTDRGKLGHELRVSPIGDDNLHDLTHVGVGVSQVLPILVLSLLAPKGSTLIFEQPELHLHPRVQSRLADFFASLIVLSKQCIIETHSEYIVNRLRLQAVSSDTWKNTMIYFVQHTADGGSTFDRLTINEYGGIENWPTGFFDESEDMSANILRTASQKRKRTLEGRNGD